MAAAKLVILSQNHTLARVKVVADASNTASTTNIPMSGFTTTYETVTSPTMNIAGLIWSCGGGGTINIYRGGTAETNLVMQLNGNGTFTSMSGFSADSDTNNSDFIVTMSQYGTLYMTLTKQSGWKTTQNAEQTGYAGNV